MTSSQLVPTTTAAPFDRAALESLYLRLERRVYNVVYRWLWNRDDAADVTQDAFVKLWSMRDRVRPETVEALVFRIAVNLASNRRRTRRLWSLVTLDALTLSTPPPELDDTQRRVRAAVDALPERLRRVVVLGELSGMTAKEIGAVLGIPEGTVASRRHAAVAILREQLGALMEAHDDPA
ncbi:MAG: sigma-70 family RNA polymerase sigma factor [Deltaproteobacteria bacterium]|nr:sigma-70 family RNA polymerase sigma factor [Deltaproteobacteria bacterium]